MIQSGGNGVRLGTRIPETPDKDNDTDFSRVMRTIGKKPLTQKNRGGEALGKDRHARRFDPFSLNGLPVKLPDDIENLPKPGGFFWQSEWGSLCCIIKVN